MAVVLGIIILVVMVGLLAWVVAATAAGQGAANVESLSQDPVTLRQRVMNAPVAHVITAYKQGVQSAPGCKVVSEGNAELIVDSKPSARILGGAYGLVMKFTFTETGGHTAVTVIAAKKVSWAPATKFNVQKTAEEVERRIRMGAKRSTNLVEAK